MHLELRDVQSIACENNHSDRLHTYRYIQDVLLLVFLGIYIRPLNKNLLHFVYYLLLLATNCVKDVLECGTSPISTVADKYESSSDSDYNW